MVNRVTLLGNLTRDAETLTGAQTTVTRMRLATDSSWRDSNGEWQRRTEFHSLVAFGDLAERCSVSGTKGRRLYVEGHLRTRDWTGSDGLRRFSTEIVADHVKYLDSAEPAQAVDAEEDDGDRTGGLVAVTARRTSRARAADRAEDGRSAAREHADADELTPDATPTKV